MTTVLGKDIAWEEVEDMSATVAGKGLDPQEVLHMRLLRPAFEASSRVIGAHLILQRSSKGTCRLEIGAEVEVLDLLAYYPVGHRIDVIADDVAADTVCLDEGRASAHERVDYSQAAKIVAAKESFNKAALHELGQ